MKQLRKEDGLLRKENQDLKVKLEAAEELEHVQPKRGASRKTEQTVNTSGLQRQVKSLEAEIKALKKVGYLHRFFVHGLTHPVEDPGKR